MLSIPVVPNEPYALYLQAIGQHTLPQTEGTAVFCIVRLGDSDFLLRGDRLETGVQARLAWSGILTTRESVIEVDCVVTNTPTTTVRPGLVSARGWIVPVLETPS